MRRHDHILIISYYVQFHMYIWLVSPHDQKFVFSQKNLVLICMRQHYFHLYSILKTVSYRKTGKCEKI